jgi:hypothetical protein
LSAVQTSMFSTQAKDIYVLVLQTGHALSHTYQEES